jgi:hypothetical protein
MEITSGGTRGPRLAAELATRDDNVYGSLPDAPPVRQSAERLVAAGWLTCSIELYDADGRPVREVSR